MGLNSSFKGLNCQSLCSQFCTDSQSINSTSVRTNHNHSVPLNTATRIYLTITA